MVDERSARSDALGTFTVERVTREDGRYLLYYAWPESPAADDPDDQAESGSVRAEAREPWTPESGPPTAGGRADV